MLTTLGSVFGPRQKPFPAYPPPEALPVLDAIARRKGTPASPPVEPSTWGKQEVSRFALDLRSLFVVQALAGGLAINPSMPLLTAFRLAHPGTHDGFTVDLRVSDPRSGESRTLDAAQAMSDVGHMSHDRSSSFLMLSAMTLGLIQLEDRIKSAGLRDPSSPLLEFLRHARNAAAHGGFWAFSRSEPRNHAEFQDAVLEISMGGARLDSTLNLKRYADLLDAVADHFAPPSPAPSDFPLWSMT